VFVGLAGWRKLKALGFEMHPTEVECCTLAAASETACIGAVNVPVTLEGRVGVFEVLVVPEVRHEMILGIDFWTGMGIVPNLRQLTWEFADPPIDAGNRPQVGNIITKDDQPFYSAPHRQGGRRNVEAGCHPEGRVGVELALPHGAEEGRLVPICYRLPRSERPVEEGVLSSPQRLPYT
jgi:hypothetical protein